MKLDGKILVAVAMVLGAAATTGCKKSNTVSADETPAPVAVTEDPQPASSDAPAADTKAQEERTTVNASVGVRAPVPPALREESPGRAPSANHVWMRGYWRWDAPRTVYVWAPGYWEDRAVYAPYAPPAVVYEDPGYAPSVDYYFVPGYWRWSGREYVWSYGHWTHRRDAAYYYRPSWVRVNGRWTHRVERYDEARRAAYERERREHLARVERERSHTARAEHERRERAEHERAQHARAERERAERDRVQRERRDHDHRAAQASRPAQQPAAAHRPAAQTHDRPAAAQRGQATAAQHAPSHGAAAPAQHTPAHASTRRGRG